MSKGDLLATVCVCLILVGAVLTLAVLFGEWEAGWLVRLVGT